MNIILFVDHDTERFKALWYKMVGEFEFDLTYSGRIFLILLIRLVLKELELFDLTSDLISKADEIQLLFI